MKTQEQIGGWLFTYDDHNDLNEHPLIKATKLDPAFLPEERRELPVDITLDHDYDLMCTSTIYVPLYVAKEFVRLCLKHDALRSKHAKKK